MATKVIQALCLTALLCSSLAAVLPAVEPEKKVEVSEVKIPEVVVQEQQPNVVQDPVPHPVGVHVPQVVQDPQPVVPEPGVPQDVVHDEVPENVQKDVIGGPISDSLIQDRDANPSVPAEGEGSDLETANTFGFGYGYRPFGYGGGWRRGYYGRGYGGYGGWGGGYGGYGGYGGWRGGYGGWRGGYGGYWG